MENNTTTITVDEDIFVLEFDELLELITKQHWNIVIQAKSGAKALLVPADGNIQFL